MLGGVLYFVSTLYVSCFKLGPNWEGPYRITSVARISAYYLEDLDEKTVPRPWNVNNLKRYHY